jgi:hypothetical protein
MDILKTKIRLVKDHGKFKRGDEVEIGSLIPKDGMHEQKDKKNNVQYRTIKHQQVEKLAELAGLTEPKDAEFLVLPTIDNMMTCVVRRWLQAPRWVEVEVKEKVKWEVEGKEDPIFEIGESNNKTVHNGYFVYMAYKRAFDRVALNAMKLFDVYSDIEDESFRGGGDQESIDALEPEQREKAVTIQKLLNKCTQKSQIEKARENFEKAIGESPELYDDLMKKVIKGMIDARLMEVETLGEK